MMANSACSKNPGNHRWALKMQFLTSQKLRIQRSQINMLTFERNDLASRVYDGRVSRDGSTDGVGGVIHVNDDHLFCLAHFLTDTDVLIWLHGKGSEPNVGSTDANILELQQIHIIFTNRKLIINNHWLFEEFYTMRLQVKVLSNGIKNYRFML